MMTTHKDPMGTEDRTEMGFAPLTGETTQPNYFVIGGPVTGQTPWHFLTGYDAADDYTDWMPGLA